MASYVFGSGTVADYTMYSHGVTGDFASADIGLVGDSITTLGRPDFAAAMSLVGKTVACDYWSSRPTAPAVTSTLARPILPRILIMACGTNDIFYPLGMGAQVTKLVNGVASKGVEHVFWVDVHCCRTKLPLQTQVYDERNTCLVNNQIHDNMETSHVVQWHNTLTGRGTSWPPYYLSDGVHPKAGVGTKYWAAVIKNAITPYL